MRLLTPLLAIGSIEATNLIPDTSSSNGIIQLVLQLAIAIFSFIKINKQNKTS